MHIVTNKAQIVRNLCEFDAYRSSPRTQCQAFYRDRLRLGKQFVVGSIGKTFAFAPSRFVGYRDCTFERHIAFPSKDGKLTTPALSALLGPPVEDLDAERLYGELCRSLGVQPANKTRTYWRIEGIQVPSPELRNGESGFPDEVDQHVEGATKRVVVNAYERDPAARIACLAHYGYECIVCNFSFVSTFGEIGREFIHVHHLMPISTKKAAHAVDPIKDLRPVCPNCHSMLHRSDPPFSVEELIEIRRTVAAAGGA